MIDANNQEPILRTSNGVAALTCTRKTQPARIGEFLSSGPAVKSLPGRLWIGVVGCCSNHSLEHLRIASGYWHANYAARLVGNPAWVALTGTEGIRKSVNESVGRIIRNELRIDNRSITSCAIAA
jgi:hypothetical protein